LAVYGFALFVLQNLALSWLILSVVFGLLSPGSRQVLLCLLTHGLAATAMALALMAAANTALGSIYEAPYLSVVLAWPIGAGPLYAAGFADALAAGLAAVAGLIAPVWVGLGLASRSPWQFATVGLAGLAAEALLGTTLAALSLCAVLRLVDAVRLRRFFIVVLLAGLVSMVLLLQGVVVQAMGHGWRPALVNLQDLAGRAGWLPHGLAARSALAAASGQARYGAFLLGWLWVLTLVLAATALLVGARTYQTCWSRAQEVPATKGRLNMRLRPNGTAWPGWALVAKDWRILLREPLFLANFLIFLLTVASYAWAVGRNATVAAATGPAVQASHFFVISFLTAGWLAQAGAMAVSREGLAWWQIQAAPLAPGQVIQAKLLLGASGLLLFFALALAAIEAVGLSLPAPGISLALLGGLVAGLDAAGLLADLVLPDFTIKLDVRMSGAHAGGKTKIVLAIVACLGVTAGMAVTFVLVQARAGPLPAALLVLGEGLAMLLATCLLGERLLRRALLPEA